jgi:hypothetical protein
LDQQVKAELTVNPPRTRARILAHPADRPEAATILLDLMVAGFAIIGVVLISLAR